MLDSNLLYPHQHYFLVFAMLVEPEFPGDAEVRETGGAPMGMRAERGNQYCSGPGHSMENAAGTG
jgi:hypothetical protein